MTLYGELMFYKKIIALCCLLLIGGSSFSHYSSAEDQVGERTLDDLKVLAIVANGFGNNYFDIQDQFELWGSNFTTAGLTSTTVFSCPNREVRQITADLLVSELTSEIIAEFDCVVIPSGGHHETLSRNSMVLEVLQTVYEEGLVIGTVCIGAMVLARSGVVNGSVVVSFYGTYSEMVNNGASPVFAKVVSDNKIVTGGEGGSLTGGGYTVAPSYQTCVAMAKAALGFSFVEKTELLSIDGEEGNFTLNVETTNLAEKFDYMGNISSVKATINDGETTIPTIRLDDVGEGLYTTKLIDYDFDFSVDLEITNGNLSLEVVREVETFSTNDEDTEDSAFFNSFILSNMMLLAIILIRKRVKN